MKLKLYDTLTREKRVFEPLDRNRVRMYVCGPTVYDFAHIGNARPVIVFDVLFRLLRHLYGAEHVVYVRNITDVDDKINARAAERGIPIRELTEETTKQFHEDIRALGVLMPDEVNLKRKRRVFIEPRATEHIAEMKSLINRLIKKDRAYVLDDHVLFRVKGLKSYGKLSHQSLEDMKSSERGETAPKYDPLDFVLWKPSKEGEPSWPSPARIKTRGRPGWHLECSAMSNKYLGERFDIHGGGIDLLFPHHENERAQSTRAFDRHEMARYWMHNGFLQVEGEKMSKSLGNFVAIRELLNKLPGDVVRLQMLMTNYRQPLDWTESNTQLARRELEDWSHLLRRHYSLPNDTVPETVIEQLADDLNTSNALTVLREQYSAARRGSTQEIRLFAAGCKFLGFRQLGKPGLFDFGVSALNVGRDSLFKYSDAVEKLRAAIANNASDALKSESLSFIRADGLDAQVENDGRITLVSGNKGEVTANVDQMVADRAGARARKDWAESDRIRNELAAMGVELEDHRDGTTTWKVKR